MKLVVGVLVLACAGCFAEEDRTSPCQVRALDPATLDRTAGAVNALTITLGCDAGADRIARWFVSYGVRELPTSLPATATVGAGTVELRATLRAEQLLSDPTYVVVHAVSDNADGAAVVELDWPSPPPGAAR